MATTYVPTSGIHVEELPSATVANSADGMIINVNNDTLSQISVEEFSNSILAGVQEQIDELNSDLPEIQSGILTNATVDPSTYTDFAITFDKAFSSVPNVVISFRLGTTALDFINVVIAVLRGSVTTNGFTIRIYNNTSSSRTPEIYWIAIN